MRGRHGKKCGPVRGEVQEEGYDYTAGRGQLPMQPSDGVIFDTGGDSDPKWSGRVWAVHTDRLCLERAVVFSGWVLVDARA